MSVSIVDLATGLVSDHSPETPTLDVPLAAGPEVDRVSVDGIGILHFDGARSGSAEREIALPSPVSGRGPGAPCFVLVTEADRDAHGWQVYRLCVREPPAAPGRAAPNLA